MIELRYYIEKNHVTAEQVKEYARENDLPMMEAKEILVNQTKPVLQYRQKIDVTVRAGLWDNASIERTANYQWTEWTNVPTVISVSKGE